VRALLGLHRRFEATDKTAMGSFNVQEIVQIIEGLLLGLRVFLSTASLITLLVGAVGVMNIMLVVVSERTKEIGLRKAVGASNREIFVQFLLETLAVTLIAGLVGAALGALMVHASAAAIGRDSMMQAVPVLRPIVVVYILATLVGTGLAAGTLPALRAMRIDPAESLRAI
jgi:putative ABC transport system permease protein